MSRYVCFWFLDGPEPRRAGRVLCQFLQQSMITRATRGHWSMVDRGLRYQMYTLCPIQHPLPCFLFQVYGRKWRPFWIVHTHPLVVSPSAYKHPRTFALTTKMKVIQYSNVDSSPPLVTADERGLSASSVNTSGRMVVAPLSDVAATTLSVMRLYMTNDTIPGCIPTSRLFIENVSAATCDTC